MAIGTYISIITLNLNGLNAPTKRHRLAEWIHKQDHYMLSIGNPLQTSRHIQTESEMMEKYIPCKWEAKESWSSNPHIRQNRPENKDYKSKGRTLHNNQGINPRGRHNNCKCLCPQHRSTSIHKTNINRCKRRN